MKVAIPTFGDRVSPRFDCAQAFLVVTINDSQPVEREELSASNWPPHERINRMVELGVDTVVCGGIDCWSAESLESAGITIYGWITGEIEEALAALVRGDLDSENAREAGGRCGRKRVPEYDSIREQGRSLQQEPIRGGGQGRRQRAGRRGGARGG